MNIHKLYGLAFRFFRPARLRRLYAALAIDGETRVLDVGGSAALWRLAQEMGLPLPKLTFVNLQVSPDDRLTATQCVQGDGRHLPFADQTFDAAVSNSVVEHLGDWESQVRFAREIQRVARRYFVQTPDLRFPVEPHLLTPFIHWLPRAWRPGLLRRFTVWGWIARPSPEECDGFWRQLRYLSASELLALFPGARVSNERLLGWPKSLIAAGPERR